MKLIKTLLLGCFLILSSCADDCVYKTYDDVRGEEQCGKFCPVEDEEGNDLVDSTGQVVLEKTKKVDIINCTIPTLNSIASSTTTTTLLDN